MCGVAGSGQKELCEAIAGATAGRRQAAILMEGKRVDGLTPREIIRKGMQHVLHSRRTGWAWAW